MQQLRRDRALQRAGDGEHRGARAAEQLPQRGKALLLAAAGDGLALGEGEIAQLQGDDLFLQHDGEVAREALGARVVGADHDERTGGAAAQRGGEIGPMDRSEPGNERGKSSALRQGGEGGGFPMLQYLIKEDVHARGLYHYEAAKSIAYARSILWFFSSRRLAAKAARAQAS